ncbi:MAG: MFS transporter [Nitrosomonas sp.]|nr:MFS transporter [Nitrosomonas sp.]
MSVKSQSEDIVSPIQQTQGNYWTERLLQIGKAEIYAVLLSFIYFFSLLSSYYMLRPMRDAMGLAGGVSHLPWLFTATFIAMLLVVPVYGWICSRFARGIFLPWVYIFFIVNILLFYKGFSWDPNNVWLARTFFVWLSVFNLFVVSVFWSLMADLFDKEQSHRLFAVIAAGGSAGAIAGPAITALLVTYLSAHNLLLFSAALLSVAVICIRLLLRWHSDRLMFHSNHGSNLQHNQVLPDQKMGGSWFSGMTLLMQSRYLQGIAIFILLASTIGTFLYLQQAAFIEQYFQDRESQTQVFALIDLAVNVLSILTQLFVTSRLMQFLGVGKTLALVPLLMVLAFIAFGLMPTPAMLIAAMVIRRVGEYAIIRPGREALFTSVDVETKYKAKHFIDTVVFRGGDALSSWLFAPLSLLGLLGIGLTGAGLSAIWGWLGYKLGIKHDHT